MSGDGSRLPWTSPVLRSLDPAELTEEVIEALVESARQQGLDPATVLDALARTQPDKALPALKGRSSRAIQSRR